MKTGGKQASGYNAPGASEMERAWDDTMRRRELKESMSQGLAEECYAIYKAFDQSEKWIVRKVMHSSQRQEDFLHQISAETPLTVELIRQMHRLWLGGVYIWAGSYRTVEMSKGGFVWPPARLVAQNMEAFQKRTLQRLTPCRAKNVHELAIALAEVQSEFLLVHPFREGNGRSARWMTDLLAMQTGRRPLEYVFSGLGGKQNSKTYLQGVIQGYAGNYEPLADFLEEAITRADLRALREDNFNPRAPSK